MEKYEYYAFRFLTLWCEEELALYSAISAKPTEEGVRRALSYFRVSRNFRGIKKEPDRLAFIVNCLQSVRDDSALSSPEAKVNELAIVLKSKFDQSNVSAASKLLWLSYRYPYIICDSQATKALKREFGHKLADASYQHYVAAWRAEFMQHREKIEKAVDALPTGRLFMRAYETSDQDLLQMVHEPWFMERVFDVLLWDVGRP